MARVPGIKNMEMRADAIEMGMPLNKPISKQESSEMMISTKSVIPDLPTQYKRIISLCPIAKVLQPYVDLEPYLEDPKKVFEEENFDLVIESSWTTKRYHYGEAYLVKDIEAEVLVGINNGRFERSTGHTGFVYFEAPQDMIAAFEYAKKTGKAIDPDLKAELEKYLDQARALSRRRVIDFLKLQYNTMAQSRMTMKENGSSQGAPSDQELLLTFILEEEIKRKVSTRQTLRKKYEEAKAVIEGKDEFDI